MTQSNNVTPGVLVDGMTAMNKKDIQRLAEIISEELGGCFIPRPFEPEIKIKPDDPWAADYRAINKQNKQKRKWMLAKAEEILARFTNTK